MIPYSGNPLEQPVVLCCAPNGETVEGAVVKAFWLDGAEFDLDAEFIVKTDDGELIKVRGWSVDTEILS